MRLLFLIVFIVSLTVSSFSVSAQKIKYKDLILLLTSKQYEKAEPFLKKYLKETDDNPNAFLYMGIVLQEKSTKNDPLTQAEILSFNADSAVLFYDKAYKTITDRELRKNDEYYEAYMRRDLRTGKFVIKLSDVQLDIENRMKSLKERKERVKKLKAFFEESAGAYTKANSLYKSLQVKYGTEKEFFLRSDDEMLNSLKRLTVVFDSATNAFGQYKLVSKELGKTGHDQMVDLQEIKDLKRDGSAVTDFMKDDLKLWDYKRWATQSIDLIEKEIIPMRDKLVARDMELNKLRSKLQKDSVSVKNELASLRDKGLIDQLKKYDPDPMPFALFEMKITELEYYSNLILNKPLHDSINVKIKLDAVKSEIENLKDLDSLAARLSKLDLDQEEKDYHHFITRAFGSASVLKSTISSTQEFAKRERTKRETEWESISQSLKWLVNLTDSIPLFFESNSDLKFKPLVIEDEKYTFGLAYQDSLATGYFYSITPSRVPDLKINFPVDRPNFKKRNLTLAKGIATADATGNIFIVLAFSIQKVNGKFPVSLAKIYRSDGLAWNSNLSLELMPSELSLNNESGEISIKILSSDGAAKIVSIDKNGKMLK